MTISALEALARLCQQRRWRLQLRSDGTKVVGSPSQLTELRVIRSADVVYCPLNKPGGAETAARRILLTLRQQHHESASQ